MFDPISAQVQLLVAEVSKVCADYLDWMKTPRSSSQPVTAFSLLKRVQILDSQIQNVVARIPARFQFGQVTRDQYPSLPQWISHIINDSRAPLFISTYSGFGPCFRWNTIRFARIRLLQLQILLPEADSQLLSNIHKSLKMMRQLEEEISSTVYPLMMATTIRSVDVTSTAEDIPSFRAFLLIRCLFVSQMTLRFLAKRGVYVQQRLAWLDELCRCVEQNITILLPPQVDPLDDDWDRLAEFPELQLLMQKSNITR